MGFGNRLLFNLGVLSRALTPQAQRVSLPAQTETFVPSVDITGVARPPAIRTGLPARQESFGGIAGSSYTLYSDATFGSIAARSEAQGGMVGSSYSLGDGDPDTLLLLHFNGSNGDRVFTDDSTYGVTLSYSDSSNGGSGTAQLKSDQTKWGATSCYLYNYGRLSGTLSEAIEVPGTTYTIEAWIYYNSSATSYHSFFSTGQNGNAKRSINAGIYGPSGQLRFQIIDNAFHAPTAYKQSCLTQDAWNFVQIIVDSTNVTFGVNGVEITPQDGSNVRSSAARDGLANFVIGQRADVSGTWSYVGWIDELRVSRVAREIALPSGPFTS